MRKVNLLIVSIIVLGFFNNANSQTPWLLQNSNIFLPVGYYRDITSIIVNDSTDVWAIADGYPSYTKSTDGGNTWISNAFTSSIFTFSNLAAINRDTAWGCMYRTVGTKGDIFRTYDGGVNWSIPDTTIFKQSNSFPNFVYFFNGNDGVCFGDPVNGSFEIYTSTNSGNIWNIVPSNSIPAPLTNETGICNLFCCKNNNIWVGTNKGRILKSSDKGLTWVVSSPLSGRIVSVAFKDSLNGIVIGYNGTNNIKRTTDGGITWSTFSINGAYAFPSSAQDLIYVESSFNHLGFYICGGLTSPNKFTSYSTDDGSTWTQLDTMSHFCFGFYDANIGWAGGKEADIYKYNNTSGIVSETENKYSLYIYPNPFSAQTTIDFSEKQLNTTIRIIDVLGKEVKYLILKGEKQITIEKGAMKAGVYFVQIVYKNNNVANTKIIVE